MIQDKPTREELVVYWAPDLDPTEPIDWSLVYTPPVNLYAELHRNKCEEVVPSSYLSCPAVKAKLKNTFVLKNPIASKLKFIDGKKVIPLSDKHMNASVEREKTLKNQIIYNYGLSWLFFSEESLEAELSSPFFQRAPHLQYGAIVPGRFNIGKWFRPMQFEFNLWEGVDLFETYEGEPLAYVTFNTDRKVVLKQFQTTTELRRIALACARAPMFIERFVPLAKRYERFQTTQVNKMVLKNIKENLI